MHFASTFDRIIVLAVVLSVCAIFAAAAFFIYRRLVKKARNPVAIELPVLALALLGVLAAGYGLFVEPYTLEVNHFVIPVSNLPPSAGKIRIVQISDLHCDPEERLEPKIPAIVENERPDLILFTGDACNSKEGWNTFNRLIIKLRKIAPIYCVKGDWDFMPDFAPIEESKLPYLGVKVVTIRGANVCLVGQDSGAPLSGWLERSPKGMIKIAMYHSPDADVIANNDLQDIDLLLCGHTHGGQIALPFYGPLITQTHAKREYALGLHRIGASYLYTNRGIGMEGHFPRMRICAKPEIACFDLVSR